ncbi:MAG: hypothetical protein MUC38_01910 [Cyclobacteriaceae bacterium]|nr:hypothetical protein [Cyclobacteriaceae bacterium]
MPISCIYSIFTHFFFALQAFSLERKQFKYQINHFLSIQPVDVYPHTIARKLLLQHHIAPTDFNRDRWAEVGDAHEAPLARLEVYASVLGTTVALLCEQKAADTPNATAAGRSPYPLPKK